MADRATLDGTHAGLLAACAAGWVACFNPTTNSGAESSSTAAASTGGDSQGASNGSTSAGPGGSSGNVAESSGDSDSSSGAPPSSTSGGPATTGTGTSGGLMMQCADFCDRYFQICTLAQGNDYIDIADCQAICATFDAASLECRETHVSLAEMDPDVHCPHASASGGDVCPPAGP